MLFEITHPIICIFFLMEEYLFVIVYFSIPYGAAQIYSRGFYVEIVN
jgi:hypothetical protein